MVFRIVLFLALVIGWVSNPVIAQSSLDNARPKLIVGITVDQMRYDYIDRYWSDFGDEGFKRLVKDGFYSRNLHYNYMPTYTAPGHASIYTGTTPAYHGIIANDWYNRKTDRYIYCAGDSMVHGVGTNTSAGRMSPVHLMSTTIGDELKLFSNQRSRVFGVAMKDRGAILPAGRTANAAYWFVSEEGKFVTSSWYMDQLPTWVEKYNQSGKADSCMNQTWRLLYSESKYDESIQDNNAYEVPFQGTLKPVFPYVLKDLAASNGNYEMIKSTPFGNYLTADFTKQLIMHEQLGKGESTDMICMSFSSTDYVGHQFGIHAMETQDCYLRLDLILADFLQFLDREYGKGNYLLFLSADHGGSPTPSYMEKQKGAFGYWNSSPAEQRIQEVFTQRYGTGQWIINESNQNIFLNRSLIAEKKLNLFQMQDEAAAIMHEFEPVWMVFSAHQLSEMSGGQPVRAMIERGFSQKYSGDVVYVLQPGYMQYGRAGTTHGSVWSYDTHVPALFYGFGVNPGTSYQRQAISDIAPTVLSICKLPLTSACTGEPIIEAIK